MAEWRVLGHSLFFWGEFGFNCYETTHPEAALIGELVVNLSCFPCFDDHCSVLKYSITYLLFCCLT